MFDDNGECYSKPLSVPERRLRARKLFTQHYGSSIGVNPLRVGNRRHLASSFWGRLWLLHLSTYEDMDGRLTQGRSSLRSEEVADLKIESGCIKGVVFGEEVCSVEISSQPLDDSLLQSLYQQFSSSMLSVTQILSGKFPESLTSFISDPERGLFPNVAELTMSCDCVDYADLCLHVAACLYGFGVIIDTQPEVFFKLRGIDIHEWIRSYTDDLSSSCKESSALSEQSVGDMFDIDFNSKALD